jgi:hypothetical protein
MSDIIWCAAPAVSNARYEAVSLIRNRQRCVSVWPPIFFAPRAAGFGPKAEATTDARGGSFLGCTRRGAFTR